MPLRYLRPHMKPLLILSLLIFASFHLPPKRIHLHGTGQGTSWLVTYYAADTLVRKASVDSLLTLIDHSLSLYQKNSLINQFNNSNTGITGDEHLVNVVRASLLTQAQTQGAFDITYASQCRTKEHIEIHKNFVFKSSPCIKIDANGIAQGYTVDLMAGLLEKYGIKNFIVELGGEIRVSGTHQPEGKPMKVGIEAPADPGSVTPFIQRTLDMPDGAITTSGNYRRKDHIIDPSTGKAVSNEVVSVTVFAKDALTADAFDNALLVMGLSRALTFVESRPELAAYFIYRDTKGNFADTASKRFEELFGN